MDDLSISDHLTSNYQDYYKDGDSEWRRLGALGKVHNIVDLCTDLPHESILEIGAGEGSVLQGLSDASFGEDLYALEISTTGVDAIKGKGISRLAECKIFDGYHIPYEDGRFDIAVLSHVVEHVEYPRKLLYEASRVAKYIFVEVPLEHTVRLPYDFVPDRVGHINFYSPTTFRRLVQSSNFRVLGQRVTNPPKETYLFQKGRRGLVNYYIKETLLKVFPTIATKFLTYHCALVCEKRVA